MVLRALCNTDVWAACLQLKAPQAPTVANSLVCAAPCRTPAGLTKVNVGGWDASSVLHLTAGLVESSQAFVLRIVEGPRIGEAGQRSKVGDLVLPIAAGAIATGHRVEVERHLHWRTGSSYAVGCLVRAPLPSKGSLRASQPAGSAMPAEPPAPASWACRSAGCSPATCWHPSGPR